ncbi:MAG: aminotransferase class III-fold pyridoxal phosphate-dependent enzyme [Gemmatimonadales bacterium]|nr:MAG: aminotransferase class III-fold pyridoxal phosphate-dependent enzyme [Gemmatimonadales bacterium]
MEFLEVQQIVRRLWGDEVTEGRPLVGEVDLNFRIVAKSGDASVLKVMHPGYAEAHLDLQVASLGHIAEVSPELPVPRVVPTLGGAAFGTYEGRLVWRISWLPGTRLEEIRPRDAGLLNSLGEGLARIQAALRDFDHPAAHRSHDWDLARAGPVLARHGVIPAGLRREWVAAAAGAYRQEVLPALQHLPAGLIHGDGNDFNVLVDREDSNALVPGRISGIVDFGDMVRAPRVCDVAIAAAYALMGSEDPVGVVAHVAEGFHRVLPLHPEEIAVLLPLARARLAVSVIRSAERRLESVERPYLSVSEAPAWDALERLSRAKDPEAAFRIRHRLGMEVVPGAASFPARLASLASTLHPILAPPPARDRVHLLDLSVGSRLLGSDPKNVASEMLELRIEEALAEAGATVGVGRWDEARPLYRAPDFQLGGHPSEGARTVHMGLDLWVPAGTPLHSPLDGIVESVGELTGAGNYGPTLLVRHDPLETTPFWTLWGHLDPEVLQRWRPGDAVSAGDRLARVGSRPGNGDWPPHLHLQVALDTLGRGHDLPGVVDPDLRGPWRQLFPNPAVLAGLDPEEVDAQAAESGAGRSPEALLRRRREALGPNLSLSYRNPLHLVSGWRQFMRDAEGRWYLDLYNNVPHVGHGNPRVVRAVRDQMALLNTNTRYLHDTILRYAEALRGRLPDGLDVVYFVNSASEANELALRMARAATGRKTLLVMEGAYHGHTTTLIEASPYKFSGPGGEGRAPWVETVVLPDLYRGPHRREVEGAASRYVEDVVAVVRSMVEGGRPPGAFLAESLPSVGGQIVLPAGYLEGVYRAVRGAGGLCIADEVQVGFGRLGASFWGFELQGVVPDLVVLGKPMGNGFPLGAVVARREVAEAFDTGMEFFSTFGGNPVACAAGLAVLEVMEEEGLQEHAHRVGARLSAALEELAGDHEAVGDTRGMGLFQGVELVSDPVARTPAPELASYLKERLADLRILTGTDGPAHNVLKLRGPMVVEEADVDRFAFVLRQILNESPFRR